MSWSRYRPQPTPDITDTSATLEWTGTPIWNAVYTVQLGELVERGVFDWKAKELDWRKEAYNEEQYDRVCRYFIERFRYREIGIEPYLVWARTLRRKLAFELMPKFKVMYKFIEDEFDIAQVASRTARDTAGTTSNVSGKSNQYTKRRVIGSDYPETILSGNSDYVSEGQDEEREDVGESSQAGTKTSTGESSHVDRGGLLDSYLRYQDEFQAIDSKLLDGVESMFIGLYTATLEGL